MSFSKALWRWLKSAISTVGLSVVISDMDILSALLIRISGDCHEYYDMEMGLLKTSSKEEVKAVHGTIRLMEDMGFSKKKACSFVNHMCRSSSLKDEDVKDFFEKYRVLSTLESWSTENNYAKNYEAALKNWQTQVAKILPTDVDVAETSSTLATVVARQADCERALALNAAAEKLTGMYVDEKDECSELELSEEEETVSLVPLQRKKEREAKREREVTWQL